MSDRSLVERLNAPSYWISGSSEGHEGDNDAPREAAAELARLTAENARLKEELRIVEDRIPHLVDTLTGGFNNMSAEAWTIIGKRIRAALEAPNDPE
jgi:hypothetical protein